MVYDQVSDTGAGIPEEDWELIGIVGFCVEPAFGFLAVPEAPTPW